jgi:hypothetical protein
MSGPTLLTPHAAVEIGSDTWDSFKHPRLFESVTVELATDQASRATVTFHDPEHRIIDKYSTARGIPVLPFRVWLGHGQNLGEPVMKGLFSAVERDEPRTSFAFDDMSFKMRLEKKPGYHKGSDLAIMKKLVTRNGLLWSPPPGHFPAVTVRSTIHDDRTDWDYLRGLTEDAGLVLYTRGDTVFAREPGKTGEPKLTLILDKDFRPLRGYRCRFKIPESVGGRPKHVKVKGTRGGHVVKGTSDESERGHVDVVIKGSHRGGATQETLNRRAAAIKSRQREKAFTVSVNTLETVRTLVDVRDTMKLDDWTALFSGKYLVDGVVHDFSPGVLTSEYQLCRDVLEG